MSQQPNQDPLPNVAADADDMPAQADDFDAVESPVDSKDWAGVPSQDKQNKVEDILGSTLNDAEN